MQRFLIGECAKALMPVPIQLLEARVVRIAEDLNRSLNEEFLRLRSAGAPMKALQDLGFASIHGELGPDMGRWRGAASKYIVNPGPHFRKFDAFLPYLMGIRSAFEVGVGPGYLFIILKELLGMEITGLDMRAQEQRVYRDLRRALDIDHLVQDHTVEAFTPIPITAGAETLVAFWTVFNHTWGVAEHEWFLAECRRKLSGQKLLVMRFNDLGYTDNPDVEAFYRERADFPLANDRYFCILEA